MEVCQLVGSAIEGKRGHTRQAFLFLPIFEVVNEGGGGEVVVEFSVVGCG